MINEAVARGARTPADVLRHFKKRRGCSNCTVHMAEAIERAQDRATPQAAE